MLATVHSHPMQSQSTQSISQSMLGGPTVDVGCYSQSMLGGPTVDIGHGIYASRSFITHREIPSRQPQWLPSLLPFLPARAPLAASASHAEQLLLLPSLPSRVPLAAAASHAERLSALARQQVGRLGHLAARGSLQAGQRLVWMVNASC